MATNFTWTLRGGEDAGSLRRYAPGDRISGTVTIVPDKQISCHRLLIRLAWHTEGRGDRDGQSVAEIDVFRGTLQANLPVSYDFSFTLPGAPWSYAGQYVNIVWAIESNIDVSLAVDPRGSQPFILAPADQTSESTSVWGVR